MTFCMSLPCVVQAAHLRAQSCGALVHHSSVEEFGVRKRGPDGSSTKKLRVRCVVHNISIRLSLYPVHVLQHQLTSYFR